MEVVWRSTLANCVLVETTSVDSYIGQLGCQNETRGGGGVNATRDDSWQHVYVAFAPISFLDKFRRERVSRALARWRHRRTRGLRAARSTTRAEMLGFEPRSVLGVASASPQAISRKLHFVLTSRAPVGSPGPSQTSLAPIGSAGLSCHHRVMRWGYNARTRSFFVVHAGVGQSPWAPKRARSAWCTLGRSLRALRIGSGAPVDEQ